MPPFSKLKKISSLHLLCAFIIKLTATRTGTTAKKTTIPGKRLLNTASATGHSDIVIHPTSYEIKNGGSGNDNIYWDLQYSPNPPTMDYQFLSGGSGSLTDGYKELTSNRRDNPYPYVGWFRTPPIKLSFFFDKTATIDKVKISVDDLDSNNGDYCRPQKVIVEGVDYIFPPNPAGTYNDGPYEGVISLITPVIDKKVNMWLYRNNRCSWMAVSEVEFTRKADIIQLVPYRYDMVNGGVMETRNGQELSFWDDTYNPFYSSRKTYVLLSGGKGQLTDGYKELGQSYRDMSGPYLGWRWATCCQPDITFFFGKVVVIDEVRISVDDPIDQKGDACRPVEAIIGGKKYPFPSERNDGEAAGPYEAVIRLGDLKGDDGGSAVIESQVRITLVSNCDWIFVSEVEFHAIDIDRDGVPDGIDACPETTPDNTSNIDANNFGWNGNDFVMKTGEGRDVTSPVYDIQLTKGCSCHQILTKATADSNVRVSDVGCTRNELNEWIALGTVTIQPPRPATTINPPPSPSPVISPTRNLTRRPTPAAAVPAPTTRPTKFPTRRPTSYPTKKTRTQRPRSPPTLRPVVPPPTKNNNLPCYDFCWNNPIPWTSKCGWWDSCSGCGPCFKTSSPTVSPTRTGGNNGGDGNPCSRWCADNDRPWDEKCLWVFSCAGCRPCFNN